MNRPRLSILLASVLALAGTTQASSQPVCRPALAFKNIQFSPMQPPTLERRWTAIVAVDASRCAADSAGYFEIVFVRLLEIGPDLEFREQFVWLPPSVKVGVDFGAYEAVERYRIDGVTPCACPD